MAPLRVLVGIVVGAQGVRGRVRIKSFTGDPMAVAAYGPLADEAGQRRFSLRAVGLSRGAVLAEVAGVSDRNAAEALKGIRLYAERAALGGTEEGEYFEADLIGLKAEDGEGRPLGRVKAVFDFGAGPLLELERGDGTTQMLAFAAATVPVVDIAGGRIVVDPPAEVEARPRQGERAAEEAEEEGSDVAG
ncbi:MAG: ribosome maturation factor RimM [Reyranellaceae bacterium]